MGILIGIGGSSILAAIVSFFWVRGIDHMKENHPNYKGDEFFGFDDDGLPKIIQKFIYLYWYEKKNPKRGN